MNTALKITAIAALGALAAGCASTEPLQADINSLKTQVASLQTDIDSLKRGATASTQAAADAQRAAQAAASKADQALATAQAADRKVDATNESMNRMFAKSVGK
jgi:murein lipoprotein